MENYRVTTQQTQPGLCAANEDRMHAVTSNSLRIAVGRAHEPRGLDADGHVHHDMHNEVEFHHEKKDAHSFKHIRTQQPAGRSAPHVHHGGDVRAPGLSVILAYSR